MSEELKTSEELAAEAETSAAETPETTETAAPEEPAETMADYAEELEASFKQIHEGDILTGTVIGVSESEITLDLKYYTEGIIRLEDFTSDPGFNLKEDVHIGDEKATFCSPPKKRMTFSHGTNSKNTWKKAPT